MHSFPNRNRARHHNRITITSTITIRIGRNAPKCRCAQLTGAEGGVSVMSSRAPGLLATYPWHTGVSPVCQEKVLKQNEEVLGQPLRYGLEAVNGVSTPTGLSALGEGVCLS
jgi:hypothetical protein